MDYNDLMLENLQKEFYTTKSPNLLINRKWFMKFGKNTIMLKNVRECNLGTKRMIYYELDQM